MAPAETAADMMTRPVITVTEGMSVTEAARVLERHRIKRAPVVRDGRVVGMLTRRDLLRPYLRADAEIRAAVEAIILEQGVSPRQVRVEVSDGLVRLSGSAGPPGPVPSCCAWFEASTAWSTRSTWLTS